MNFNILTEKVLHYFSDDSNFCVNSGLDKNLGALPDPGKNKLIQKQGQLRLLSKILKDFDQNDLSSDQLIDIKLIELLIEQENVKYELEIDGVLEIFKKPVASSIIMEPIYTLLINDSRDIKYRLVNIISRLKAVPTYLQSMQRNLNKPVRRWVDIELESMESLESFFESILRLAKESEFKNIALLEDLIQKAVIAKNKYVNFLNICETTKDFHLGLEQTKRVIKSNGIDMTVDQLHELAVNFIKDNSRLMNVEKTNLILKYDLDENISHVELQSFLNQKFKVSDILAAYSKVRDDLVTFIKDKDLVSLDIDEEIDIIQTPEFMKNLIPAGAMCPPLALREGIKRSLIFLTLDDDNSSDHNELTIPSMMIHEAYPGHHLQFAYAANNKSIIRRIFQANDLSEGWATYLEEYLIELGFNEELKAEMKYLIKRDIARIGARVAIDLYFMIGDVKYLDLGLDLDFNSSDPFENAKNLLIEVTGFSEQRADGELNWYSMERGYPMTYLVGNHLMLKLKSKLNMIDSEFHCFVLSQGNIPLSYISNP